MVPVHGWAGQLSVYVKPAEGKVRSQDAKQGPRLLLGVFEKGMVVSRNTSRRQSFGDNLWISLSNVTILAPGAQSVQTGS